MERSLADALNKTCDCVSTDAAALARSLGATMPEGWAEALVASHPNLFAPLPVFVGREELAAMRRIVSAVERVAQNPAFATRMLSDEDETTQHDSGARGVFFGFDFHLSDAGPKLIEINTNAGGALLQLAVAQAQKPCCEIVRR